MHAKWGMLYSDGAISKASLVHSPCSVHTVGRDVIQYVIELMRLAVPRCRLVQRQYEAAERDLPGLLLPDPDEPEMEGEGLWPGLGGFLGA